jgi:hypothetical protein
VLLNSSSLVISCDWLVSVVSSSSSPSSKGLSIISSKSPLGRGEGGWLPVSPSLGVFFGKGSRGSSVCSVFQ